MAKNRDLLNQIQRPSFMSPSLPHTVAIVADDDDDNDICPVCDGECTCSNYHPTPSTSSIPPSPPSHDSPKPVLKIKLPSNLLQKRKSQTAHVSARDAVPSASTIPEPPPPKRRGRPPKNPALRAAASAAGPSYQRPKPKSTTHRNRPLLNKSATRAKSVKKRKRVDSSSSSSSELTDVDLLYSTHNPASTTSSYNSYTPNDDDDAQSVQFPTFVSAISSASSSGSDTASLSGFETDFSIEAEEESFIRAEERARVRRELLNGAGEESLQKRRDNNWVIRPRKMSVGTPSDVDDMDVDSDATEGDDDDEEEEEDDDEDDEPDGDETEDIDARDRYGYTGLVTAWSEDDEESSFDADLFFANLSDSESGSSGFSTQSDDGDDGDHSDLDFDPSDATASLIPHIRQGVGIGVPNLPFEVTEGWDGQVVFTNGLGDSHLQNNLHGLLEASFLPPGPEASPSPGPDGDIDMTSTTDADEEGYEQDVGLDTAEAEGEGDTTDEELVGEDNLPNERAMSLFNTPFSFSNVSAINPMSTMSPVASPSGPSVHKASPLFGGSKLESPKPADILAGRLLYWGTGGHGEDLEDDEEESNVQKERREREKEARGGLPRSGQFEAPEKMRQAVIDDAHKDVPSSYPRYTSTRRGRGAKSMSLSISHTNRISGFENLLRQSFQSIPLRPSSLPPPSSRESFPTTSAVGSPESEMPVEMTSTPCTSTISTEAEAEEPSTQPIAIDLDDVLDASFLAASEHLESSDIGMVDPVSGVKFVDESSNSEARKHIRNLNRWDVISVGAFRKTRENCLSDGAAGWGSDSGAEYAVAHGNAIKSSPLSTMLWQHRHGGVVKQQRNQVAAYATSPELGPLKDGDRTPTDNHPKQNRSPFNNKTRKEMRRERKLKRKSYGPVSHHQQYHHHHHHHHHHPNSKSRSTGSSQRMNFFNAPVPSLSI